MLFKVTWSKLDDEMTRKVRHIDSREIDVEESHRAACERVIGEMQMSGADHVQAQTITLSPSRRQKCHGRNVWFRLVDGVLVDIATTDTW